MYFDSSTDEVLMVKIGSNKRLPNERGVEMVELALIMPVIILICFGVVDLLRLSYFQSMLQRAASDIAVQARFAPNLDVDLKDYTIASGEYYDFVESRQRAISSGINTIQNSFSPPGTPSDAQLIRVSQLDNSLGNYAEPSPAPFSASAVILRPGEQATFSYTDDHGATVSDIIKHPILPPTADGKVAPQKMDVLLERVPVHVEVRALVHPLLYFVLGTRVVRGVATTYRENGIRRTAMIDNEGNDTKPPTATRKIKGPGEVWFTSPEPDEPLLANYNWNSGFYLSSGSGTTYCARIFPLSARPCSQEGL